MDKKRLDRFVTALDSKDWKKAKNIVITVSSDITRSKNDAEAIVLLTRHVEDDKNSRNSVSFNLFISALEELNESYELAHGDKSKITLPKPNFEIHPHSEKEAQERAKQLALYMSKLTGVSWHTRVWRNLHWYYIIYLGGVSIGERKSKGCNPTYHAQITDEITDNGASGEPVYICNVGNNYKTGKIEDAYLLALGRLETKMNQLVKAFDFNLNQVDCATTGELASRIVENSKK